MCKEKQKIGPGTVAQACSPNYSEAEARRSLELRSLRPAWEMQQDLSQPNTVLAQWNTTEESINLDTDLIPSTKINSKWLIDLPINHKSIKLLEDDIEENLDNLRFSSDFLATMKTA